MKIERLDQALCVWEEAMWLCAIKQRASRAKNKREIGKEKDSSLWPPLEGPLMHHKGFRRHLLEMGSIDDFDFERFQLEPKAGWVDGIQNSAFFASQLAAWTHASRRVYHIDNDLKALLGATSLEGLHLSDIHFPFEAFGVSLDDPIEGENGLKYDFVLFAPVRTVIQGVVRKFVAIRIYSTNLEQERLIPREAIDKMVARGRAEEAEALLRRKASRIKQPDLDTMSILADTSDMALTELIGLAVKPQTAQAYRIVFGLMLYLKMLADARTHVSDWQGAEGRSRPLLSPDKRAITDEAQVCYVSSVRKLGAEERQALNYFASGKVSGHEMPYHFREGHWRRPPGKGDDPTWPKTVLVQPTVVRKDRKPDDAIAGGSLVCVK
ncbi:MAG: hypothetical protein KIH67_004615 [Candidatus Moranbacteria bacterium]|nr:hypothetical protein [Candidatus Moranbacteria bacterium]